MSWSSDSQYICTRNDSMPTVLWIWDINHLELAAILVQKDPIRAAAWDPTFPRLVLCTGSSHIYMWTPSGAYCINVPLPQFAVIDLKWNSDGSCLFLKDKESFCCASPEILQESSDYSSDDWCFHHHTLWNFMELKSFVHHTSQSEYPSSRRQLCLLIIFQFALLTGRRGNLRLW